MTLAFLKLYADMESLFEPFSDEERGRLFSALMAYVFRGEETAFTGNERFLWPVLRRHADACAENSRKLAENGARGGRPKGEKAAKSRKKQTKAKESLQEQEQEQEQEEEQKQEQEQEEEHAQEDAEEEEKAAGKTAPAVAAVSPDSRFGKDGALADALTREYGLSADRITREALRADLAQYGEARLRAALREACLSNTRERVSVRFWRAILSGPREKKPAAFDYLTRPEAHGNDPLYWRALEVDLDGDLPEAKDSGPCAAG